ncbi:MULTISPECIES: hypothetical protein [Pontibacillus]|uniref:Uncharacterized protein n=1 Tax=Pontibacillus chungwhensis TaxID=265426 RepID=A0ABY8UXF5_9BACI|nr:MULTISPECIES: hypothetical protein [Pontibacillus]MCD5325824.1 hypothetical protein [Pontibacillus sp. HN14]WIF98355.1 hypothetical protein QNI29_01325 [Pontibacillus chungwhensis]
MSQPVSSFVVRFHLANVDPRTKEKTYRIKVTHVQTEHESTFDLLDEAVRYMKGSVDREGQHEEV